MKTYTTMSTVIDYDGAPVQIESGIVWEKVTVDNGGTAMYHYPAGDTETEIRRLIKAIRRASGGQKGINMIGWGDAHDYSTGDEVIGWGHYGHSTGDGGMSPYGIYITKRI